jgi:hypothetical protein
VKWYTGKEWHGKRKRNNGWKKKVYSNLWIRKKNEQMKRQQLLKHELDLAYKIGDEVKWRKLQKQLEPNDATAKVIGGAAHL